MRASIGFGLIAVVGLLACATEVIETSAPGTPAPSTGDGTGVSTDPNDPAAAPVDPTDPDAPQAPIVSALSVSQVAVFQAVKIPVVNDGVLVKTSARKAPVVAKRPGLLRVYVTPGAGFAGREVTAELRLVAADGQKFPIVRETKRISAASTDEDVKSTFNLELPAESLPAGVTFNVALTATDGVKMTGSEKTDGRFPADGSFADLGAELSGKLRLVLVPVKYDTDGSGRTPNVSAAQVELYKKTMMRVYPASEVEVTTHAPYSWTTTISGNGTGFSSVLRAMAQLRQTDKVPSDVYYYGLLAPTASMGTFCQSRCVTGLSTVVENAATASLRASVGVGFTGQDSANTMAHEVGHAHGREHAPCGGAQNVDASFPYAGGAIGVWGYDIFTKTLISPTKGRDMMGYCPNEWISDYNYNALFDRISTLSVSQTSTTNAAAPKTAAHYRVATLDGAGALAWDGDLDLDEAVTGGAIRQVSYIAETGASMVTKPARFFRFDHLPGGFLLVEKETSMNWKAIQVDGLAKTLAR